MASRRSGRTGCFAAEQALKLGHDRPPNARIVLVMNAPEVPCGQQFTRLSMESPIRRRWAAGVQ
jgi:hypothetical protein